MIQVLMIAHALTAVFLLGALTHQAFSVSRVTAAQKSNIVDRFRGVSSPAFTNTIIVLFVLAVDRRRAAVSALSHRRADDARGSAAEVGERHLRNQGALCRRRPWLVAGLLAGLAAAARAGVGRDAKVHHLDSRVLRVVELPRGRGAEQHQGAVPMSRFAQIKVFSTLYGAVYTLCFYFQGLYPTSQWWAPFRYYPSIERVEHRAAAAPDGRAGHPLVRVARRSLCLHAGALVARAAQAGRQGPAGRRLGRSSGDGGRHPHL